MYNEELVPTIVESEKSHDHLQSREIRWCIQSKPRGLRTKSADLEQKEDGCPSLSRGQIRSLSAFLCYSVPQ